MSWCPNRGSAGRQGLLLWLVVIVLSGGVIPDRACKAEESKPNILLIVSDALRADILGCYGGLAQTPHLDSLAAAGVLFENAYSTAPATMASSVSMFTGNYSSAYTLLESEGSGSMDFLSYVGDAELLLGEALLEAGYDVRRDIENRLAINTNALQGFEPLRHYPDLTAAEIEHVEQTVGLVVSEKYKRNRTLTEYARLYGLLHYLLTLSGDTPFFLVKWIFDPHDPYDPVPEFRDRIEFDTSQLPRDPEYYHRLDPPNMKRLTPAENEYIQALYRAEVESVDDRVGYILAALRAGGLESQTVVVFTSDHGDMFGAHGHYGHGGAYWDPLLHIPLIYAGPGIDSDARVSPFVSHLDLSPTLEQLARIDFPDAYLGQSYLPLLEGGSVADRVLYFDRISNLLNRKNMSQDAMLADHFKLVVAGSPRNPRFKLYDLAEDPGELAELGNSRSELLERLFAELQRIRAENQTRLVKNTDAIADDVDLESVSEETRKQLRALGYVD